MAKRPTKRLVIDADVLRAAGGEDATHPVSKHCRDFLVAVLEICHRAALTAELAEEWRQHESRFARMWRARMRRKGKVCDIEDVEDDALRDDIDRAAASWEHGSRMLKDAHLLEGALATDKAIVSRDGRARTFFAALTEAVARIRRVMWVDPVEQPQDVLEWLRRGAPLGSDRTLTGIARLAD